MNKHIIFDLDETIGYFQQFIFIMNVIDCEEYSKYFKLFEEYFRPNIFHLFEKLLYKKKIKHIKYVILYTNNNNPHFVHNVMDYIHSKLNHKLFDYIITYNSNRIHKNKSYEDLIHCIPSIEKEALCFIDDKIHICMKSNSNVSYIKCEKYIHELSVDDIISRLNCKHDIKSILKKYKYSKKILPPNVHTYSTKRILQHIEIFISKISVV